MTPLLRTLAASALLLLLTPGWGVGDASAAAFARLIDRDGDPTRLGQHASRRRR